ncbi:MAG: sigma-E factor negative regulatory protein [Arenimonas sp.]
MNSMNTLDDKICEQLSAWMDGELSKGEAMFLERRLQHDEALQAMYSRLQMTSACMKGQSALLMSNTLCANIKQALAEESSQKKSRSPIFAWAAAASLAFAAIVFIPGMMQNNSGSQPAFANKAETLASPNTPATFASADLIANSEATVGTSIVASSSVSATPISPTMNPSSAEIAAGVMSPEDFPLVVSTEKKSWPRSPVNANSDPALEAYLVRHNQMMAQDGMGGFVPYVDVVAQDAGQPNAESLEKKDENPGGSK